jgi:Zn finger protein HypA/HybF involved in hydrogenase expression
MNAIPIPCDCCNEPTDSDQVLLDKETDMICCPECHKFMIIAQAQLGRGFDQNGNTIKLKRIHRRT